MLYINPIGEECENDVLLINQLDVTIVMYENI